MFTHILIIIPLGGLLAIFLQIHRAKTTFVSYIGIHTNENKLYLRAVALNIAAIAFYICLAIFVIFDFGSNHFQFVQGYSDLFLGVDGLSLYFVLLTSIIMPISLLSNWTSIRQNIVPYSIIVLLLEMLLLGVFLALDVFLFYVFFESILPPLFLLIGLFGSIDRVRAGFYLFLYTLFGSLFLLLAILKISSTMGFTDLDALYKTNIIYYAQLFLFCGVFLAFAVKTPTIFLNTWLLKAHVESPLSGSIILAGIVLKLSLYGVFRLILPLLPKAYIISTYFVYMIGVITIVYASISTIRTIDVKELIASSSVCHAAVYLMAVFSNTVSGIEGGILLGLAHGFVSSGLFICVGGVLYDRSSTRLITYYRGMAQVMPLFSIIFFILCLGNCGVPLTLNFIGEFMSLYGVFERQPVFGVLASSSIVFSAAYTIFMFNKTAFAGSYSKHFTANIPDLNKREFYMLLTLVVFTVALGIYPAPILDGLHYSATTLIYSSVWLVCIIPMFRLVYVNKANYKFIFMALLLILLVCYVFLRKHFIKIYNFPSCVLYSPPKTQTFVNLPLQSCSLLTLFQSFVSSVRSSFNYLSSIVDMPDISLSTLLQLPVPQQLPLPLASIRAAFNCMPSVISSYEVEPLTVCMVLACLMAPLIFLTTSQPIMPSIETDDTVDVGTKVKPEIIVDTDDEDKPKPKKHTVDIRYMKHGSKTVLYDDNQNSGIRLKELFPAITARLVCIGGLKHAIQFAHDVPSNKPNQIGIKLLAEATHIDYDGKPKEGIWVAKPSDYLLTATPHLVVNKNEPILIGPAPVNRYLFLRK